MRKVEGILCQQFCPSTARPAAGETDEEIVAGAWDFALTNRRYEKYLAILDENSFKDTVAPAALRRRNRS